MTAALEQIKAAYEKESMSPSEIAEDQDLDVAAVKAGLMQCSTKYRKDCGLEAEGVEDGLNFTDDQLRHVNNRMYELTMSEDEHLAFKACTYIRDDKKGRKEIVKAVQHSGANIFLINNAIQAAREGAGRVKQSLLPKVIDA